jgi:uncharacterized protein
MKQNRISPDLDRSHFEMNRRDFISTITAAAGLLAMGLSPAASPQDVPPHPGKTAKGVQAIDASQVRLLPGSPFYDRQELHRHGYLASFGPDRLLFHYRALAKLPQPENVTPYGGWDSGFVRGHMIGHYLSAASRMAVATGDRLFRDRADYIVAELSKCQDALKLDGYLAAFPLGAFDRLEGKQGNSAGVVVPYYTIHKIMAGLLDAHDYLGNQQALAVAGKMADYFEKRLALQSPEEIERIFRTDKSRNPQNEFGAMSDVLAQLHEITKDPKHLAASRLFNREWFMGPLAKGEDHLAGLHGNTHIAQALGLAHCANITGDAEESKASENFWRIVTRDHSFVIGGNTVSEWFDKPRVEVGPSIFEQKSLPPKTAESCNTHNMLKLTARLFERNPNAEYADYTERALYNHLVATVAPDTGLVTYFTPLRGSFRTYLVENQCCVGTGIENTPRYNESIYFQQAGTLWVNLYIPSVLNWQQAGLVLQQEGDLTRGEPVRFTVVKAGSQSANIYFRIPQWIAKPAVVTLNGKVQESAGKPSTYVSLKKKWKAGDVVTLTFPASLRLEQAKDDSAMVSVFYGPVLLAGELGRDNMPNDSAASDANMKSPPVPVPDIVSSSKNPADWLQPIPNAKLEFIVRNAGPANGIYFRPFYHVHHQRYSVYWRLGGAA